MHLSVFNPASPQATELLWLWNVCMWVCGFVLAAVTLPMLYIIIRYRQRGNDEPRQVSGNKNLEIVWTLIPLALVAFLFVVSITTARAVDHPIRREADIVVTGHQWWWEVRYPAANAITANEIHVPVGREMLIGIEAADVIHDFWVPRLGRKVDAIPGRRNFVWIRADESGRLSGGVRGVLRRTTRLDAFSRRRTAPSSIRVMAERPGCGSSSARQTETPNSDKHGSRS